MLTVKTLLAKTPERVRYRASVPRIHILKDFTKKNQEYRSIFAHVALGNTESTGDSYNLTIRCHGTQKSSKFNITPDSFLWVHCSCPYFTYHLEVVLKLRGSSKIENSNAEMPKIKNPSLRPYLCKHLYALTIYMIARDTKYGVKDMSAPKRPVPARKPPTSVKKPASKISKPPAARKPTGPSKVPKPGRRR